MSFTARLDGRVALVTGASSGLGRHFALTLANAGARVALAARRTDRLADLAREIARGGGEAAPVRMDVTDAASVARAVGEAEAALGAVEVLVNNSGLAVPVAALETGEAEWDTTLDTNLRGAFLVAQAVARRLVALGRGGTIVNIGSVVGLRTMPQLAAYGASKAALHHLTRILALEWARHRIRVNAIAPGYIETDINREHFATPAGAALVKRIPQRRLGQPEDLDGVLLLLASDASAYMTGTVVQVDGGHVVAGL